MRLFQTGLALVIFVSGSWFFPANSQSPPRSTLKPGTIEGTFDVPLSGSATYAIPLKIPPGTAGTQPKLSLVYNSQAPASSMGVGWSVSGLSKITRGPKNQRTDKIVHGVDFKNTDAFYLDGQRLIPTGKSGVWVGKPTSEYVKEIDDQTHIRAVSAGSDDPAGFVVETKAGLTILFGLADNSQNRLFDKGPILTWMCNRITDSAGNYIDFSYANSPGGDYEISSIAYTGNDGANQKPYANIVFNYAKIVSPATSFISGYEVSKTRQLTSIASKVGTAQASEYKFQYCSMATKDQDCPPPISNRVVLRSITQYGESGSEFFNATQFQYSKQNEDTIWLANGNGYGDPVALPPSAGDNVSAGYRLAKFKVDTDPSRMQIIYGADIRGVQERAGFKNTGSGFSAADNLKPPTPFVVDGDLTGAVILDLDNNEMPYLIAANPAGPYATVWHWNGSKWETPTGSYQIPMSGDGVHVVKVETGNFFGQGRMDVVWTDLKNPSRTGTLRNDGAAGLVDTHHDLPMALDDTARFIDVNCDGIKELAYYGNGNGHAYAFDTSAANQGWVAISKFDLPAWAVQSSPVAIKEAKIAGKCPLLIVADARYQRGALIADPANGWKDDQGHNPDNAAYPFVFVDSAGNDQGAQIVDVSGQQAIVSRFFSHFYFITDTAIVTALTSAKFPQPADPSSRLFIADLNSDGSPDIIYFSNSRYIANEIYLFNGQNWQGAPANYLPGVSFARSGTQDLGVRLVDLHGNGLQDIISSKEVNGVLSDQKILENTGHGWSLPQDWSSNIGGVAIATVPVPMSADYNLNNAVQFVDIDGDGFIDLVWSIKDKSGNNKSVFYKNAINTTDKHHYWTIPADQLPTDDNIIFGDATAGDRGVRFVDLDGDGVLDIIYSRLDKDGLHQGAYLHKKNGWTASADYKPPQAVMFVVMPGATGNSQAYSMSTNVQFIDVNGDGLPDLVYWFKTPSGGDPTKGICLNTGKGWPSSCTGAPPVMLDQVNTDFSMSIVYSDLNGDGLIDIVVTSQKDQTLTKTFLGNGIDWTEKPSWKMPSEVISARNGDPGFRLVDINGDGLPDLIFNDGVKPAATALNKGYSPATGSSWDLLPATTQYVLPKPLSNSDGTDSGVRILDVDGSGLPDLVLSYDDNSGTLQKGVWINRNRRANIMTSVVDGLGVTTAVCYRTLLEVDNECNSNSNVPVYQAGDTLNTTDSIIRGAPAMYVVASALIDDGTAQLNYSYHYSGLRFDALARRSMGFGWREATDLNKNLTTRTELNQEVFTQGLPNSTKTTLFNGTVLDQTQTKWIADTQSISSAAGVFTIAQIKKTKVTSENRDLDGSLFGGKVDELGYDQFLNVQKTVTTRSDNTSVAVLNDYSKNVREAWLGRLRSTTITKTGDPIGGTRQTETRTATFDYDPNTLLLSEEISNVGAKSSSGVKLEVAARYARDPFGNIKTSTLKAEGEPTRASTRSFSADGRFTEEETNAAGHKTARSYSPTLGTVKSMTDPNGLITKATYDGFGRPETITDTFGVVTKFVYGFVDGKTPYSRPNAKFQITATTGNLPLVISFFDRRGRPIRKVTSGTKASTKKIFQDTDYDEYGRVIRQTKPYFENELTPPTIARAFDKLDRVYWIKQPDPNSFTKTFFHGRSVTVESSLNGSTTSKTTTVTNVRNLPIAVCGPINPVTVCDPANTKPRPITYEYDASDRIIKITSTVVDDLGNPRYAVTSHSYDSVGHRAATEDPDLGGWTYRYDAYGQLREQQDARQRQEGRNQVTTIEYDKIGRPKKRTAEDRQDTWSYDNANGIGKLASLSSSTGSLEVYREDYRYTKGRLVSKTTGIDKGELSPSLESFRTSYDYDQYGRMTGTHYADGFSVKNIFDDNGYLVGVVEPGSAKPYWSASEIDAIGRVTSESLGNGVTTQRKFDPLNGYLASMATSSGTTQIQDITFKYDAAGDLIERTMAGHTQSYTYDTSQRLTTIQVDGGSVDSVKYDEMGSILAKPGSGANPSTLSYDYDHYTPPFHAPKVIADSSGVSTAYTYDDGVYQNGNRKSEERIAQGGSEGLLTVFKYSTDNRVTKIFHPKETSQNNWSTFEYAAGGQRFRQTHVKPDPNNVAGIKTTTITVGLYERATSYYRQTEVLNRHYLVNSSGVFAVVDKSETLAEIERKSGLNKPKGHRDESERRARVLPPALAATRTIYLHKDSLGSVTQLTDEQGKVLGGFKYDPWGVRRDDGPNPTPVVQNWSRGYTGHAEILQARYVHMNGRVYDPEIASFVSPDLVTQVLTDERTFNRYAYALDNPLKYTDPSGYWPSWHDIGNVFSGVASAVGGVITQAGHDIGQALASGGQWIEQNWREVVIIAVAIGATVITAGAASPILAGLISGAVTGGLGSALYGGSLNDVLSASLKGAVLGAIAGGIANAFSAGSWQSVLAHGNLGGLESVARGGDFIKGFEVAALNSIEPDIAQISGFSGAMMVQIAAAAALSGTLAAVEGGKFANGAAWGAFAQIQIDSNSYRWSLDIQSTTLRTIIDTAQTIVRDVTGYVAAVNALPITLRGIVDAQIVSVTTQAFGLSGDFRSNLDFVRAQMATDPFTFGQLAFSPPRGVGWADAGQYGFQASASAYFGTYWYQFVATGNYNFGGQFGGGSQLVWPAQ